MDLHSLVGMVFLEIDDWPNPLPKSFHRIWEILCNPRYYRCELNQECQSCNKSWDIFFKENLPKRINHELGMQETEMYVETERVSCPDCGYPMRNYMGRKVIGIIRSDHDGERVTGNDIRGKF